MPTDEELQARGDQIAAAAGATVREVVRSQSGDGTQAARRRAHVEAATPTAQDLETMLRNFDSHLSDLNVQLPRSVIVDSLAAYLSSQFLLFAGPSGTGKSTLGRALASFFCHEDSWHVIEARRQLIGPEELVGYVSPLTPEVFFRGPEFEGLEALAWPGNSSPALLVEELNLSPVEGYLSPFTHGLSGVSNQDVEWPLHGTSLADPPRVLRFAPFPRLLGTINVDATAHAPAPKVAARASVLLLEPLVSPDLGEVIATTSRGVQQRSSHGGLGAPMVGDPIAALTTAGVDTDELQAALERVVELLNSSSGAVRPSRRQLSQMAVYVAWFVRIARAERDGTKQQMDDVALYGVGAENALLHHVLPSLPARDLDRALTSLEAASLAAAPTSSEVGPLLGDRVAALTEAASTSIAGAHVLDFWDRLS